MKKFLVIAGFVLIVVGCDKAHRNTGHAYMPDMAYSVAFETYAPTEERLAKYDAHYNNQPVEGTIARGDMFPYKLKNDTAAIPLANPLTALTDAEKLEASRLYLVNCAICHGPKLNGDGPLYKGGSGPFSSAPANLMTSAMTEGSMFYVATYGKNAMGSYASQLSAKQRWMIISYIKDQQRSGAAKPPAATGDSATAKGNQPAAADTSKTKP